MGSEENILRGGNTMEDGPMTSVAWIAQRSLSKAACKAQNWEKRKQVVSREL